MISNLVLSRTVLFGGGSTRSEKNIWLLVESSTLTFDLNVRFYFILYYFYREQI